MKPKGKVANATNDSCSVADLLWQHGGRCPQSGVLSSFSALMLLRITGDQAFPVAAARAWNTLPVSLQTVSSDLTFGRELNMFNISFPDN